MKYTKEEILQYVLEEDVKFIRLAFCDIFGKQKNISIMPSELKRAFDFGVLFDASAIAGFGDITHSDLVLHPEPDTLTVLPWRPEHGRVVRMICTITYPDGTLFESDPRAILKKAIETAKDAGYCFNFGTEMEFYLFKLDEMSNPTDIPCDQGSYMDVSPDDKGENVRRDICLTLEQMGIQPEGSHHEMGPGQNEIDFRYADALTAADNAVIFNMTVKTIAQRNGMWADFSPKPIAGKPGNGMHINMSVKSKASDEDLIPRLVAGVLKNISDMTLFLNPTEDSYKRLGEQKAPRYISWAPENRSQLIRIPAASGPFERMELRSPDPQANPYLAFALMIYAALDGINNGLVPPEPSSLDMSSDNAAALAGYQTLPQRHGDAVSCAVNSEFIAAHLPKDVINAYIK